MKRVYVFLLLALCLWTGIVALLLRHAVASGESHAREIALVQARAFFRQVLDVRGWNASHGGVYVEVTERTRPNPYLDVPERDIETVDGRKLTLINPAYMTRQIAERGVKAHGVGIHITSLAPVRPANAPAEWEARALRTFEEGAAEYAEFFAGEGGTIFRYMAPLMVEESCLRCHGKQGYKVGDVRGGISITIPEDALMRAKVSGRRQNAASALVIWLIGAAVVLLSAAFVAQKQRLLRKLESLSLEDPLTGLRNRRGFVTLCEQEMAIARRYGKKGLLLFIDLDGLKLINDTYGHAAGDEALQTVAGVIGSAFRRTDVKARVSGDEFAVFCLDSSREDAGSLKEHLDEKLRWENSRGGRSQPLSISVGCAEYQPGEGLKVEELMARADADMYVQKKARKTVAAAS